MSSGMSGRYPRPMQLFQQLDFSAVPMSSYSDLTNLMDVTNAPQSNSVLHHLGQPVESNSNSTGRSMTGEYTTGRPAADFCMPSLPAFQDANPVPGIPGNFNQHFQHFSNQMVFPDSSYHNPNIKVSKFANPWCSGNQPSNSGHTSQEPPAPEPVPDPPKPKKGRKPSANKKKKKEKVKRVRYIKPGCSDMCRRRCKQKISQSMREDLFNTYWNLEDDAKRKEFISTNAIKMPMMKCKEGSRRSFSVDWAFTINGESFSVCKLFFLHTLDIPENTAYAAVKENEFFEGDTRTPVIKGKVDEKKEKKPAWFETDLDDYSSREKKGKSSQEPRYGSFTQKERFSEMRPGCKKHCRKNCHSKFTYGERLAIFNEYRNLSNIRKEREYISTYISRMQRKRVRTGESTRRGCSILWTLPLRNKKVQVCKTFFLHTVGVSERAAYNIGIQREIQPVETPVKRPKKNVSGKMASFGSMIAKGKLKSALRLSRRKKKKKKAKKVKETTDEDEEYEIEEVKTPKKRGRKRKRKSDRTVQLKKMNYVESEDDSGAEMFETEKMDDTTMKISPTLFRLPIKKRQNLKHRVPVMRIKHGVVYPVTGKKRNPYKRKAKPSKTSYSLCPDTCKKKCKQNLSEEARKEIFNEFWALDNMEEQRKFISKCVKKLPKPSCTCLVDSHLRGKRRGYTIAWSLNFRGLEVPVCKTFFMHVLQVSDSVVYKAVREDDSFTPEMVPQPCKHFTGRYPVPKPNAALQSQMKAFQSQVKVLQNRMKTAKTEVVENSGVDGENKDLAKAVPQDEDNSVGETGKPECVEPCEPSSDMLKKHQNADNTDVSEMVSNPSHTPSLESGSIISAGKVMEKEREDPRVGYEKAKTNSENIQSAQKLISPLQQTAPNTCNIEANYETLIPSLNNDHPHELGHPPPHHLPNQLMNPYVHGEKFRNVHSATQPPLPPNCNQNELWPKSVDSFHSVFNNSHPVFPTSSDTRVEPLHNIAHSRDLATPFAFQQNNNQHSHFPSQPGSAGHHSSSFSHLHPDLPAPQMNQAGFDGDIMNNFYQTSRFHNFGNPVNMPREFVPPSSDYSMDSDQQAFHDTLLMQTLKKTNNDMFPQSQNMPPKAKRKRKKQNSAPKPKVPKVKGPRIRKPREKKPFTRYIKPGCCVETCKRNCFQKIPQQAREELFNEFWGLENDARRREYILPIVNKVPKKTCSGVNSRRCCTVEWSMFHNGETHIVCKRFFLDTLDIGEKFVKTIFDKLELRGGSMEDLRGRHCKRSAVVIKEHEEIEKHIRSVSTLKAFQCMSCRKDFTRWDLDPGVIVTQLYRLYAEQRKQAGKKPACRSTYTEVCTKKFNLRNNCTENLCDLCSKSAETHQALASPSNGAF